MTIIGTHGLRLSVFADLLAIRNGMEKITTWKLLCKSVCIRLVFTTSTFSILTHRAIFYHSWYVYVYYTGRIIYSCMHFRILYILYSHIRSVYERKLAFSRFFWDTELRILLKFRYYRTSDTTKLRRLLNFRYYWTGDTDELIRPFVNWLKHSSHFGLDIRHYPKPPLKI